MNIIIRSNNDISINIHKYSSIYHLRSEIENRINIKDYYLEYSGKILLDENKSLEYYGIKENSLIDLKSRIKGGVDSTQIIIIVLCVLFVFIFIPLLIFSGLIPFLLHITECLILQLLKSIEDVIIKLPRFYKYKGIFEFILKIGILVIKYGFLYYGLGVIFTLTLFSWNTVINGGKNLFIATDKYCEEINSIKSLSQIGTIIYLIVYLLFRLPNIIVSSLGSVINLGNKTGFSSLMTVFNIPYQNLLKFTYENKWDMYYSIPGLGEVLKAVFEGINLVFDLLVEYTSEMTSLGCKIKSLGNFNNIKKTLEKTIQNKQNYKLSNEDIKSHLKRRQDTIQKVCCDDSMFEVLKEDIGTLIKGLQASGQDKILKEYGISIKLLKLLEKSFDTKFVEESQKKFKDSFFIFKLMDGNVEGVLGKIIRTIFCNIINISKYTSDVLFKVGTPEDMADTVKCGIMSGQVSLIFYYFSLTFMVVKLIGLESDILNVVITIAILLLLYMLKGQYPFIPVPLII